MEQRFLPLYFPLALRQRGVFAIRAAFLTDEVQLFGSQCQAE